MQKWLQDVVKDQGMWYGGYLAEVFRIWKVGQKLPLPDDTYGYLSINHPGGDRPSEIIIRVDGEKMGETARALLPVVGSFKKKFDESDGDLELVGTLDGITVTISGKPPESCTVEKVVEEIEVPAEEAHTEKVTRYVMTGDCDPLLKPPEPEPETVPEETQSPTEEDVQHA